MVLKLRDNIVKSPWGKVYMCVLAAGVLVTALAVTGLGRPSLSERTSMGQLIFGGGVTLTSLCGLVSVRAAQWRGDDSKMRAVRSANAIVCASLVLLFGFCWWAMANMR